MTGARTGSNRPPAPHRHRRSQATRRRPYRPLAKLITLLAPADRAAATTVLADHQALLQTAFGSAYNHQAWPGGWWQHTEEVMNLGLVLYATLSQLRPLPFSRADLLVCLFLHDLEKPWRWRDDWEVIVSHGAKQDWRIQLATRYGFILTPERINAINYAEGEKDDYRADRRVMNELAALVHTCDSLSARLWHDHPAATADAWSPDRRSPGRFKR